MSEPPSPAESLSRFWRLHKVTAIYLCVAVTVILALRLYDIFVGLPSPDRQDRHGHCHSFADGKGTTDDHVC